MYNFGTVCSFVPVHNVLLPVASLLHITLFLPVAWILNVTLLLSVVLLLYVTFVTVCSNLFLNVLCPVMRQTEHWLLPANTLRL